MKYFVRSKFREFIFRSKDEETEYEKITELRITPKNGNNFQAL